jgi:U4/U6.U5 tri-snRNP-associated protein 2
MKRFKVGE